MRTHTFIRIFLGVLLLNTFLGNVVGLKNTVFATPGATVVPADGGGSTTSEKGSDSTSKAFEGAKAGVSADPLGQKNNILKYKSEGVDLGPKNFNINPTPYANMGELSFSFIRLLTGTVVLATIATFMIGAGFWIFSAGDESRVERGKDLMTYSIVGILVVLGSYALIKLFQVALYTLGT
ncbi:hypothetical protein HZA38_00420 [Candidatus Peregrinibacteria bacterium]|nr:hypothetical protein [Candidatus Peregrinibacteria bacterium]